MTSARAALLTASAALAWAALAPITLALADEAERRIAVRPSLGYADVAEAGTTARARVHAAGVAASFGVGLQNWLELGGDLAFAALGEARYDEVMLRVDDAPMAGPLKRRSQLAQLRGTVTLRLGVVWVPTLQLAIGAGVRNQSSGLLRGQSVRGETIYVPDGLDAGPALDLVAAARVGLEHRFGPRWSVGVSAGAMQAFGIGVADLRLADASLTLARLWYPSW